MAVFPRIQRQAACGCGSGRPLAECCLPWEESFHRLGSRLVAFAQAAAMRSLESQAGEIFWNTSGPLRVGKGYVGPDPHLGFLEWTLHEYARPQRKGTFLGRFADGIAALDAREETLLLASLLTPIRTFEVGETLGPRGCVVRDVLSGGEFQVGPCGLAHPPIRSDLLICRLLPLGRLMRPGMSLLTLPAAGREELLAYLRTTYRLARPARHVSLEDFLDASAHLYHHFFLLRGRDLGGQAGETVRRVAFAPAMLSYAAEEMGRVHACLSREDGLERQESKKEETRYAWVDPTLGLSRATIILTPGMLALHADTREDVAAAGQHFETSLRGLIRRIDPAEEGDGVGLTSADSVADRMDSGGARFLADIVARWPSIPHAALGGRAPRQVVAFRGGREQVTGALQGLERDLARLRRLGRPSADPSKLWEVLGLSPDPAPAQNQQSSGSARRPPPARVPAARASRSGPRRSVRTEQRNLPRREGEGAHGDVSRRRGSRNS